MRTIAAWMLAVGLWIGIADVARAAETASATFIDEITPAGQQDPPLVVFRTKDDQTWQPAAAGMDLADGDYLWVKEGATAVVKVGGTAVMHLEPDTVFTVPEGAAAGGSPRVQLEKGSLWTSVKELTSGQTFTVQTKDAIGGVKGTQFRTSIDPGSLETDWDMVEGKLELATRKGEPRPVLLEAGHSFRLLADGRPAFAAPRRDPARLRQLASRFRERFRRALPDRSSVRAMLRQRNAVVPRPIGRLRQGPPAVKDRSQRIEDRRERRIEKRQDRIERRIEKREDRPDRRGNGGFRGPGGLNGRGVFRGGRSDARGFEDPTQVGPRRVVPGVTGANIGASDASARVQDVQTSNRVNQIVTQVPILERRRDLLQREKDTMISQVRTLGVDALRPRALRMVQEQRDISTRVQRIDQETRTLLNRSQGRGGDLRVRQRLEGIRSRLRQISRPVVPPDLLTRLFTEESRTRLPPPPTRVPPPDDNKRPPPDGGDGTGGTGRIGGNDGRGDRIVGGSDARIGSSRNLGPVGAKPSRPR